MTNTPRYDCCKLFFKIYFFSEYQWNRWMWNHLKSDNLADSGITAIFSMKKFTPWDQNYSFSLKLYFNFVKTKFYDFFLVSQCFRVPDIPALHLAIRLALLTEVPFKILQAILAPINWRWFCWWIRNGNMFVKRVIYCRKCHKLSLDIVR